MPAVHWPWPGRPATRMGQALALVELSEIAAIADDLGSAVQLARQAGQITAGIPGRISQACCMHIDERADRRPGDLAAAESVCAAGLAQSRTAGHLENTAQLLNRMVIMDLRARRDRGRRGAPAGSPPDPRPHRRLV